MESNKKLFAFRKKKKAARTKLKVKKTVTYPHFRRYKKEEGGKKKRGKHPKLIVERVGNEYGFMGLTKSPTRGHHANVGLSKNPEKGNSSKAYLRKELRYDSVENFSEILENFHLSEEDKKKVLEMARKMKLKKK